jgi:flagellar hook assembly protein FlgD
MKVSSFFNYPNPFSKSTQFIFYLTGTKIPDEINIKIVNIKGQVVKEISKEELGPLKIGLNKTNYQWNGNDQFGNYLASGVYIYKVDVKDQNKEVDLMSNQELLKLIENDPEISTVLLQQSGKMIIVR